jgi:hypothetical protein
MLEEKISKETNKIKNKQSRLHRSFILKHLVLLKKS